MAYDRGMQIFLFSDTAQCPELFQRALQEVGHRKIHYISLKEQDPTWDRKETAQGSFENIKSQIAALGGGSDLVPVIGPEACERFLQTQAAYEGNIFVAGGDSIVYNHHLAPLVSHLSRVFERGKPGRVGIGVSAGAMVLGGNSLDAFRWFRDDKMGLAAKLGIASGHPAYAERTEYKLAEGQKALRLSQRLGGAGQINVQIIPHFGGKLCPPIEIIRQYPGLALGERLLLLPDNAGIVVNTAGCGEVSVVGEPILLDSKGERVVRAKDIIDLVPSYR
jgi:hypothetical protein